ncbi:hypothetical protein [Winogradskyella pulchriflava]|uniref:Lipoprotein n=1 Tax=Winogradskyella pulchriflava TaxID=1110688 RepID=A0ABV6Q7F0_9FLAO
MKTTKSINSFKLLVLTLIFPTALALISCSSDDSDDGSDAVLGCNQLINLSTEYSDAFTDFQANPSEETCNDLRNVALNLIDAVGNCPEFADQYSELEAAAQGWTELDCSQDFD